LFRDKNTVAALFDFPAIDGAQGRRTRRFACALIETGMMPRTAHAAVDNEAVRKRTVIMAAMRTDGEDFAARPHQQNLVVADMTEKLVAGELGKRHAFGEIGTRRRTLFLCHDLARWSYAMT